MSEIGSSSSDNSMEATESDVSTEISTSSSSVENVSFGNEFVTEGISSSGGFSTSNEVFSEVSFAGSKGIEINGGKENTGIQNEIEIPIDITRTTPGRSQILETFPSMEEAQKSIEEYHKQSIDQIIALNGQHIPEQGLDRIMEGVNSIKAVQHNSYDSTIGSFSFHNNQSDIRVSNINDEQMECTTKHETNHFASFNREIIVPSEKGGHTVYKTSGVRQVSYVENPNGDKFEISNRNRGLNEGSTTMYTIQQLDAIDPDKGITAARQNAYQHATEICQQLETLVGKETMASAYYGGDLKCLETKVDALAGEKVFERLSKDLDRSTYSKEVAERVIAMKDAQGILAKMSEGREKT